MVPPATPLSIPDVALIVATEVLLLDHVPPDTGWLNKEVAPWHITAVPVIAASVYTDSDLLVVQPLGKV